MIKNSKQKNIGIVSAADIDNDGIIDATASTMMALLMRSQLMLTMTALLMQSQLIPITMALSIRSQLMMNSMMILMIRI